jgi:hypothetical protein
VLLFALLVIPATLTKMGDTYKSKILATLNPPSYVGLGAILVALKEKAFMDTMVCGELCNKPHEPKIKPNPHGA